MQPRTLFYPIYDMTDPVKITKLMRTNGLNLQHLHPLFKNNFHIALTAVQQNRDAFQYVPLGLKDNKEFVQYCLAIDPWIIVMDASERLKRDPELINAAIVRLPTLISMLSDEQARIFKNYRTLHYAQTFNNDFFNLLNQRPKPAALPLQAPDEIWQERKNKRA